MTWLLRLLIALAAAASPVITRAQTAPGYYKIVLTIERDGQVIGTPTFIAEPGTSAIMANSRAGYYVKVDVGTDGGLPGASIRLATELYLAKNDRWEFFGKPTIVASIGRKSALSLSNTTFGNVNIAYDMTTVAGDAGNIRKVCKDRCAESRIAE